MPSKQAQTTAVCSPGSGLVFCAVLPGAATEHILQLGGILSETASVCPLVIKPETR